MMNKHRMGLSCPVLVQVPYIGTIRGGQGHVLAVERNPAFVCMQCMH